MKRTGFTITFEDGESHTRYLTPIGMKNGFWLDNEGNKLQQEKGLTTRTTFGENVKLQIETFNVTDGEKLDIRIKAKIGEDYMDEFQGINYKLEVKNNLATLENFYLDPKWYNEEIENYYYKDETVDGYDFEAHQTGVNPKESITFVFETKFEDRDWDKARNFPENENDYLRPITYRRNYEELIGLFKTNNSGEKDTKNNYESKFIDSNPKIKSIADEFSEKVITPDITIEEIKTLVKVKALWETAVKQVQSRNLDDRPLYWARNKMQTWLKRNPLFKDQIDIEKSLVKKGTELDNIIILFEELSRNYTGIDFSKSGNKKKVLITGFDPFILNEFDNGYLNSVTNPNILQSNPSGVIALALSSNNKLEANIQTMIIPVRYTDFDKSQDHDKGQGKGIIEEYIKPFISQVDMIITISQAGKGDYNIDKYATATRGGFNDNQDFKRNTGSQALIITDEWIETTLPKEMTNAPFVEYNWNYDGKNGKTTPPKIGQKISYGPGGDYLSNEIFYRVAKLRKDNRPKLATGHFHISKIQGESEDLEKTKVSKLVNIVKKGIEEGIKNI